MKPKASSEGAFDIMEDPLCVQEAVGRPETDFGGKFAWGSLPFKKNMLLRFAQTVQEETSLRLAVCWWV